MPVARVASEGFGGVQMCDKMTNGNHNYNQIKGGAYMRKII